MPRALDRNMASGLHFESWLGGGYGFLAESDICIVSTPQDYESAL